MSTKYVWKVKMPKLFTILLPIITVVIIAIFMDFSCYLWLKRTVHPTEEENQDIPIINKETQKKNADKERERKRKIEVEDALRKREQ